MNAVPRTVTEYVRTSCMFEQWIRLDTKNIVKSHQVKQSPVKRAAGTLSGKLGDRNHLCAFDEDLPFMSLWCVFKIPGELISLHLHWGIIGLWGCVLCVPEEKISGWVTSTFIEKSGYCHIVFYGVLFEYLLAIHSFSLSSSLFGAKVSNYAALAGLEFTL